MKAYFVAAFFALVFSASVAAQDFDKVEIKSEKVADGIYVLFGAGGNIGVSIGDDGVLVIDDQFAPLTDKIKAAIAKLSDKPVAFVLNTHWHGDHTGGNENMASAGAVIVAHDNVRARMSIDQNAFGREVPASPAAALPVVTFSRDVTFHFNGEEIAARHVSSAHTDGDSVVEFRNSNVVHTGDVFFNSEYPFIDTASGGSVDGVLAAVDELLSTLGDDTRIIPGHGPLSNKKELVAYRAMLVAISSAIGELIAAGKSVDEVVAAKPTKAYDAEWGDGYFSADKFVQMLYSALAAKR